QEAGLAERQPVRLGIDEEERPGDSVADRAGLAGDPTALDLDHRVVATLGTGHPEGHPDLGLVDGIAEMLIEGAAVHDDLTLAGQEPDTGDRRLATAGPGEEGRRCHEYVAPRQASGSGRCASCGWSEPA